MDLSINQCSASTKPLKRQLRFNDVVNGDLSTLKRETGVLARVD